MDKSIIDGIDLMFEIIDCEVGDQMYLMKEEDRAKIKAVADWLARVKKALEEANGR